MSENVSVVACLNKQGWVSRSLVSVDTSDLVVNGVAGCEASGQVHSGEMECHHRSAQSVQTDCTYRVVPPSEGLQRHLQDSGFVCASPQPQLPVCVSFSCIFWDHLGTYAFPPFTIIRSVLNKVMLSDSLSLVLAAPLWPHREWFPDLLYLLVAEPLEHTRFWNLLIQPHIRKLTQGFDILNIHAWKLSSVFSGSRAFFWWWLHLRGFLPQEIHF